MDKNFAIAFIGNNIFYHLGAIKAIEEYNIYNKFKAVSGTGVGVLSAVMFAKKNCSLFKDLCILVKNIKRTYIKEEKICEVLSMHTINKSLDEKIHSWSRKISSEGMIDCSDIEKIIKDKHIDITKNDFKMDCYVAYYELPFMRNLIFKLNNYESNYLEKIILNSVAKPIIFNKKVKSKSFITADINSQLSVEILKDNNYKNILIVDSDNMTIDYKYKGLQKSNVKIFKDDNNVEKYIKKAYNDTINVIKNNLKNIA
ncbi:hypothetical protein NRP93_001664 [Clostridium botulinum]|nr:hypothetical protein [Clostridium botulinum]